jgi:hypothetical protein
MREDEELLEFETVDKPKEDIELRDKQLMCEE